MNADSATALSVAIKDLQPVHVARVDYLPGVEAGDMHELIHACFERIQAWMRSLGLDPMSFLHIGVPVLQDGQLMLYECCVQVPANLHTAPQEIRIKDLPGGRYAVLSMSKDPAIIGASIGRFYQEYIPDEGLGIDARRPTYEIYYDTTMEYCVAIT